MNRTIPFCTAIMLAVGIGVAGQGQLERITVPLSNPGRPVTLDINLYAGAVTITAVDGPDVVIEASGEPVPVTTKGKGSARTIVKKVVKKPAPGKVGKVPTTTSPVSRPPARDTTGLTQLPQPPVLEVDEADNVVRVRGPVGQRIDMTIQVPVRTSLRLKKSATGASAGARPVTVRGLDGDLEISTEAGSITLTDVAGSVVAHSTSGSVIATVRRVTPDRPMAFTSYSGNVDVSLPSSLKADLLLQSDRGNVFTNFGVKVGSTPSPDEKPGAGFRRTGRQPIRASVNGGGPDFELRTFAGSVYLRKVE